MVENVRKRFGGRLCPKLCHFWLAAVVAVRSEIADGQSLSRTMTITLAMIGS